MKCFSFIVMLLFLCGLAAGASAEITVGTEISADDITDFFYTRSTSTDPPFYRQYRFYAEDQKKFFFHETREGGGWPQTEQDITASGTVELTEADWAAFFSCLAGGNADRRSEDILDGDDGPWTYLYWTGDEGEYQEFSFASPEKQLAFENLCSRIVQNHILTRFYISRGGYMPPQSCEITLQDGSYTIQENKEKPRRMDPGLVAELQEIIQLFDVEAWDGFDESNPNVLDGEFFSLELKYADGTSVYATGDNAFPNGYFDVSDRIETLLQKEKMSCLAGTYRCEGEGPAEDCTIWLNADGTYSFCEGSPGSCISMGTWDVFYNAVYMKEDEESGSGMQFMFGVEDGALIYIALGSDEFPYNISDGERCIRQTTAE